VYTLHLITTEPIESDREIRYVRHATKCHSTLAVSNYIPLIKHGGSVHFRSGSDTAVA
jgi:hypothetical protein